MARKITISVVVLLALSGGIAYAAAQLATADETHVCVNNTNGLMRVASPCREGEHPLAIGGGGNAQATQDGASTVAWGSTGTGKALPLTGVTLAGKCELVTSPPAPPGTPDTGLGRLLITTGGSMTGFTGSSGTVDGQSLLTFPATTASGSGINFGVGPPTVVTANGAIATITFGARVSGPDRTCMFLWQAVEARN